MHLHCVAQVKEDPLLLCFHLLLHVQRPSQFPDLWFSESSACWKELSHLLPQCEDLVGEAVSAQSQEWAPAGSPGWVLLHVLSLCRLLPASFALLSASSFVPGK